MNSKTIGSSAVPTEGVASGAASVATGEGGSHEAARHDIAVPNNYRFDHSIASHVDARRGCKELIAHVTIAPFSLVEFVVYSGERLIYRANYLPDAVAAYNSAQLRHRSGL